MTTKYWKLKDNSAVESHENHVNISEYADEINEEEFNDFISNLSPSSPPKTDLEKVIERAKIEWNI